MADRMTPDPGTAQLPAEVDDPARNAGLRGSKGNPGTNSQEVPTGRKIPVNLPDSLVIEGDSFPQSANDPD
jgi:hypothetical protein